MNASFSADPVRLGLLGLNFGKGIAQILRAGVPELAVRALCDLDGPKVEAAARELGVTAYTSLDAMLRDPALEAIGLFSGPLNRAQLVRQILRAGKHVLTTKPFELDPEATRTVLAETKERGLVLHLNSPATQSTADLRKIETWVHDFQLGAPIGLAAATWANYREVPSGTWYDDPKLCPVAPLLRLGIYFLNDFIPLLGTPTQVQVSESRIFTQRPTSDNALLSVQFAQGALASVFASFCIDDGEPYRDEVTLHYERGTIRRWIERMPHASMNASISRLELRRAGQSPEYFVTEPGDYAGWYQWRLFARAVRGDAAVPRVNAPAIQQGVDLLAAVARASSSGFAAPVQHHEGFQPSSQANESL